MRLKLHLLYLFCCLAVPASNAKELVFSYSTHPLSKTVLIPILQRVYGELGYQLSFQEAEGPRAIKLLNDGVVDGDVGRLSPILQNLDTDMPAILLGSINIVMYCRLALPCDNNVLQNPRARVLIPTQDATLQLLTGGIKAKPYFNNDWNSIINMFNAGKVDYMLWIESELITPPTLNNINKTETSIGPFKLYHILHSRHEDLFTAVSQKIQQHLSNLAKAPALEKSQP